MYADECTNHQNRISYARVLIDMDVTQELPHEIDLIEPSGHLFSQQVEYDWKPLFCKKCVKYGHKCRGEVSRGNQQNKTDKQVVQNKGAKQGRRIVQQWNNKYDQQEVMPTEVVINKVAEMLTDTQSHLRFMGPTHRSC